MPASKIGVLIIQENSGDPPVIRSSGSLYSGGLLLPGQSFPDSSHGSEPLGQTAAEISPLTRFHEWPNGS